MTPHEVGPTALGSPGRALGPPASTLDDEGHEHERGGTGTLSSGAGHGGLGLVLSSGAARGAIHAGVLQVLEAAAVPVRVVAGTSAGALVGAAWAGGVPADVIAEWVSHATWADFGSTRPNRRLALLDTGVLRERLDEVLGARLIEEFPRRFGAVATDVRSRTPVLLDHGSVTDAVCSSIAVPGLFPPMRIDGRLLVDGHLTSPTPVWAARRLGAQTVIAVRLTPATSARPGSVRSRVVSPEPDHLAANLEIVVDAREYSAWSPRDVSRLIELGRRSTEHALADIQRLVADPAGGQIPRCCAPPDPHPATAPLASVP